MSARHAERQGEVSRVTRSGRKITYCLRVIQQPERARACGSGAKSSADRRPVDPPPVVELRVFEGEGPEKEDITFSYEANFFLFASLELARPIAHGRSLGPPQQQPPPVLTGMPVSGMAYLDRPTEAGYFIFPDLSVRHEGRYKLSFNLYEQTKREHDLDAVPMGDAQQKVPNGSASPDSSFDFRMEVKSSSFMVWSAKKFPGLKESTALSRQVAEQGCRVRIRRDVRMRRRPDGKPGTEYDESYEDQYARNRAEDAERRSPSRSSTSSESPMNVNGQPYYHNQPGNNLSFIPNSGNSQFAAPPPQYAQPQHAHHQPQQPPATQHYPQQNPAAIYRPPPPPSPHSNYTFERQYPQSAYPSNPPRESSEQEPRRASAPFPSGSRDFMPVDPAFNRPPQHHYHQRPYNALPPSPVNIPPIKPVGAVDPKYDLPPVQSRIVAEYPNRPERSHSYNSYTAPQAAEPPRTGGKRAFDSVFKSSATASNQPLYNGQRPSTTMDPSYDDDDDDDGEYSMNELLKMSYKRADGCLTSRDIPNKA